MSTVYEHARQLFDLPPARGGKSCVELRALTHGVPPKAVSENLRLFVEEWKQRGVDAWNNVVKSKHLFSLGTEDPAEQEREFGWWALPEVIGDRFISPLLNAPKGTCIMLQNATQIVMGILTCREFTQPQRRKIICTDGEFPAVLHSLHNYNRQYQDMPDDVRKVIEYDICMVEMGDDPFDEKKILSAIDDETAFVIFSHVGFVRGERVADDVIKRIADACHAHGALLVIDGYHAVGSKHIDVQTLDIDLYFGGLLKEGCGSSGNCFLYIRKGLDLHPSLSGWFGDKKPFGFSLEPEPHEEVRRRFLTGTTPIACLYHGIEGLRIMLSLGLDAVADDILSKTQAMVNILTEGGVKVISPTDRERMSAMIVVEVEQANKLREFLAEQHGVLTDARRNSYLRMAPHIYNSLEEVEMAANAIVDACAKKSYKKQLIAANGGPVT